VADSAAMGIPYVTDIDPAYGRAVELSPMVRRIVADNPGRFTYTGTGTYIVGRGQVAVIDPGPDDDAHVAAILAAVAGEEISHIVVTHTHRDHSPAAAALHTATGAPTYGFGPHPTPDPPTSPRQRPPPGTGSCPRPRSSRSSAAACRPGAHPPTPASTPSRKSPATWRSPPTSRSAMAT
jgi:glyoxylase-like metal-dependent hydrolase (beta-lactamase superfamily II)